MAEQELKTVENKGKATAGKLGKQIDASINDDKIDSEPSELSGDSKIVVVKETKEPQLIFDLYDINEVKVNDPGLKGVINLDYHLVIKSYGRSREKFGKTHVNIIERLVNMISVPGHRGKKHKIITRWATGKYNKNLNQVLDAFKIIKEKTNENPIQVLVNAVEKGSPMDEVTMIQYGGARYPQAVDSSPLRRVSVSLRNIVHGAYDKSFKSKTTFVDALANELIATAKGDGVAVTKRTELEKQADAAR